MAHLIRSRSMSVIESGYFEQIQAILSQPITEKKVQTAQCLFDKAVEEGAFLGAVSCSYHSYSHSLTPYEESRKLIQTAKQALLNPKAVEVEPLKFEKIEI